jgi:hypothetical protein
MPRVQDCNLKCQGKKSNNKGNKREPFHPGWGLLIIFRLHFILLLENKMKSVFEIIIGALIFMSMDRLSRIISRSMVDKGQTSDEVKKSMLRIELLTLFLSLYIAFQFIKL